MLNENNKKCEINPNEILTRIKNVYKNEQFLSQIGFIKIKDDLILLLDTVFEDISNIENNKPIGVSEGRVNKVNNVYNFIIDYLFESKTNNNILNFINDVNFVLFNWYSNLIKNNELTTDDNILKLIQRCETLINMNFTLRELFLFLRDELSDIKKLKSYEIPAFKLSEHYLNVLNGE